MVREVNWHQSNLAHPRLLTWYGFFTIYKAFKMFS